MIIYRPHRGSLEKSISEAMEFEDENKMKEFIVKEWNDYFDIEDIVIVERKLNDTRVGWRDSKMVCVKRFGEKDNIKTYGCPQCIGLCATDYDKIDFIKKEKL